MVLAASAWSCEPRAVLQLFAERERARRPARRRGRSSGPGMRRGLEAASRSNPPPSRIVTSSITRPYGSRQVKPARAGRARARSRTPSARARSSPRGRADTSTAPGRRTRPSPAPDRTSAGARAGDAHAPDERPRGPCASTRRYLPRPGTASSVRSCAPLIAVVRFSVIDGPPLRISVGPGGSSSGADVFSGTLNRPTPLGVGLASSQGGPPLMCVRVRPGRASHDRCRRSYRVDAAPG